MTRPEDLLYAVDELPPWPRLVVLGMQHAMLLSVNLVLIVIVFRRAGAGDAATLSALSLGMIALAISSVLQSMRKGPVGSGYLAPPVFSAIYIGAAVLAAGTGGLPAVFGMTIFAGLVEISLAYLLRRLRALFPPAISGFIVVIVAASPAPARRKTITIRTRLTDSSIACCMPRTRRRGHGGISSTV